MMKPASKIKAIMIFIASSEFKMEDTLKGMFMDFRVLSKRLNCRVGTIALLWLNNIKRKLDLYTFFAIQSRQGRLDLQSK